MGGRKPASRAATHAGMPSDHTIVSNPKRSNAARSEVSLTGPSGRPFSR